MNEEQQSLSGLYALYILALQSHAIDTRKFVQKNPGCRSVQPCYHVDVTDLAVDLRFDQPGSANFAFLDLRQ